MMNLTSLRALLCRTDVRIIIICTATGGILQVVARKYIKSHPEFFDNAPVTKPKYKLPKFISPRGGAVIEITGVSIKIGGWSAHITS